MKYKITFTGGRIKYMEIFSENSPHDEIVKWNDPEYNTQDIVSIATVTEFPEPEPDYSTLTLTVRQFFIMLANSGYVTPEEAVAAAQTGVVPANIAAVFATLPPEQALAAQITWAKMVTVARNEPLIAAVAASLNLTEEEIDQFFIVGQTI